MAFEKKTWKSGDVITYNAMNRLEEQVADNTNKLSSIDDMDSLRDQIAAMVTTAFDPISEQISATEENLDNLVTKTNIYGSSGEIDNGSEASLKDWISAQIANLGDDITALEGTDARIKNALGSVYDITDPEWTLGVNKSIDTRLIELHNAIFGDSEATGESLTDKVEDALGRPLEPTAEEIAGNSNYGSSLLALIEAIQATLGMNGGSASGSLVDTIENALGRPLSPTEQERIQDPNLTKSLYELIQEIRSTLGMEGASSSASTSTLINDVDTALNLLYGYTKTVENNETTIERNTAPVLANLNIINSYPTLYNDFYNGANGAIPTVLSNLQSTVTEVQTNARELNTKVSGYDDVITDLSSAYRAADVKTYNDKSYLILKSDLEEEDATTVDDMTNKTNTYVELPQMGGGGGGTAYELDASFTARTLPTSNAIAIGDNYIVGFTWSVLEGENPVAIDGTLTIRLNGTIVDTIAIMSNTYDTYNLGRYITTSGRNAFTITAVNVATPTRTLYTTVMAYNAVLESNFDASVIQTGSSINYSYTASIGSSSIEKVLHISLDGTEIQTSSSLSESLRTVAFPTPAEGDHLLETWFTANVGSTTAPVTITSNKLAYGIICGLSNSTRIATNFNQTSIEQYQTLTIDYLVVTPNQDTTVVNFYVGGSATPIVEEVNTTYQSISFPVTQNGGTLTIRIVAGNAEKTLQLEVISNETYDFSMVDTGLQALYTGGQMTNANPNRTIWENSAESVGQLDYYKNIQGTLENFLYYNTNNFDGWLRDNNGQTFLRLRNRGKVKMRLPIFNFNVDANGKITDGMTFEIDFKTSDVTNYNTEIISCYEEGHKEDRNIIFTAQNVTLNNSKTLVTQYKEEERLTISFVVENSSKGPLYQLIKIYINGILSGAVQYESTALSYEDISKAIIELGSEECTLDVYSIRFYNRPLTFAEVIKNWIYDTGSYTDKIARYNRNNYKDSQGRIAFNSFRNASPDTPYMIIAGEGDWNNEDGLKAMPTTKSDGTYNTTEKGITVEYTNPLNPAYSFTSICEDGEVGVAIQGTSSQEYKRKNYKIKLSIFLQDGKYHVKSPAKAANKDNYYVEEYDGEGKRIYNTLKSEYTKTGYKLSETSLPTFTFCIKADVASSESANNVLMVRIYDDLVRTIAGLTPPQEENSSIRQGVEGYPMIVWYLNKKTNEYTFLGKYNFNNDKGTKEVYGFQDGDESWEVGNNERPLCFFEEGDGSEWNEWRRAFETRYPDDDSSMTKEEDPYTDEQIADRLAGLREMVHWVSSSVDWTDENKEDVVFTQSIINAVTPEDTALANTLGTTPEIEAYKREFQNYFHLNFMVFFFVYTELFLMVDNRAKNMFMTRYKVTPDRPYSGTAVTLHSSVNETAEYTGWFSLPYDMDTGLGTDNVGRYKFDYHYESGDYQPDGSVVFNGQKSKLWVTFRKVFPSKISETFRSFFSNISAQIIDNMYENHQGVWSETIVNEDMEGKYIDWITYDENGTAVSRDTRALPMLLGLKVQQRKAWLFNRFLYFISKEAPDANDSISLGVRKAELSIPVSVYADSYVTFKVGAQDPAPTRIRVGIGETKTIVRDTSNSSGTAGDRVESSMIPASRIKSIGNLATLQLNNADFSKAIRLQSLQIGSANPSLENTRLDTINLTGNRLLRNFDLRNCSNYSADLSLQTCLSLEKAYLSGTKIKKVMLPNGGVLRTIQYPETITEIKIENQPYLTNLIIGSDLPADEITEEDAPFVNEFDIANNDYSNITSIVLDNIGESINVPNIVVQSENLASCSLNALVFRMTSSAFKTFFDKLVDVDATVTNCTLYLEDDLSTVGMTVNDITDKFDIKIFDKTGAEYFNVRFYDFEGNWLATRSVASGTQVLTNDIDNYFTPEVEYAHNNITVDDLANYETIQGFGGWNVNLQNVTTDLEARPVEVTKYRMAYHYLQDYTTRAVQYLYFAENASITRIAPPVFIYEYNQYNASRWTADSNEPENYPEEDERTAVSQNALKQASSEDWYLCYTTSAAVYQIRVYNTDTEGNKTELLGSFERTAIGSNTTVTFANLEQYMPAEGIIAINSTELNVPVEEREYQFLCWQPKITSDSDGAMQVVGDTDILLRYYKTDDVYTNYFLNKITELELSENVTRLPPGSFINNSNLTKLITYAENIGENSFSAYFNDAPDNKIRYFVFKGDNVTFDDKCFYNLGINSSTSSTDYKTVIIFEGTGQFTVAESCFNAIKNCIIIIRNSDYPIRGVGTIQSFVSFNGNNNRIYVSDGAREAYDTDNAVPAAIKGNAGSVVLRVSNNWTAGINIKSILEEVGIDVD